MAKVYVAFDGDNVGKQLSLLIEQGNDDAISCYAMGVAREMSITAELAKSQFGAVVLMCSGDSLLFKMESGDVNHLLSMFGDRSEKFCTYSIGVGRTVQEAHQVLLHAKMRGKNRVEWFTAPHRGRTMLLWSLRHPIKTAIAWLK